MVKRFWRILDSKRFQYSMVIFIGVLITVFYIQVCRVICSIPSSVRVSMQLEEMRKENERKELAAEIVKQLKGK